MESKTVYRLSAILIGLMLIASGVAVGTDTVNDAPKSNASLSSENYWAVIAGYGDDMMAYRGAESMYNVLTRASDKWNASNIQFFVNETATKANIRDAIQRMANKASAEDTCLFYFTGHGNTIRDYSDDEADGFDESLTVFDDYIIDDELEEWIGMIKAQKVIAILDACHSGGILTPFQTCEVEKRLYTLDDVATEIEGTNCVVLAGCRMNEEGEYAYDLKNGLFTYYVVQGLWGAADNDDDGRISVRELCDYSFPKIEGYQEETQHPILWPDDNTTNNFTIITLKTPIAKTIMLPEEYLTIQKAVEAAMPGDVIEVSPGTYTENVIVNKPLTISAPYGNTIIHAANTACSCILVTVDSATISGLTCQKGSQGIELMKSCNNIIANNIASKNNAGIYFESSDNNRIYLNNFITNTVNANSLSSSNIWNSSSEIAYGYNGSTYTKYLGNYWDDYEGSDVDGDGIGDTPYSLISDKDNYPLILHTSKYSGEQIYESPSPTQTQEQKTWHYVSTFTGTKGRTTEPFAIKGDVWRVKWLVKISSTFSFFYVHVFSERQARDVVAEWSWSEENSHRDTKYIHEGNGSYYFSVSAMDIDEWELEVEDYY
ncbi:CASH domain-containing protein [Methanophagales archaeon]|nr:CASH domain-containing protein [Methanophagales archaeon]